MVTIVAPKAVKRQPPIVIYSTVKYVVIGQDIPIPQQTELCRNKSRVRQSTIKSKVVGGRAGYILLSNRGAIGMARGGVSVSLDASCAHVLHSHPWSLQCPWLCSARAKSYKDASGGSNAYFSRACTGISFQHRQIHEISLLYLIILTTAGDLYLSFVRYVQQC